MTARRSGTLAVALVAGGVLVAVLLVTWAASIGPSEVLRGDGIGKASPTAEPSQAVSASSDPQTQSTDSGDGTGMLHVLAIVLNVATVLVALALLGWLVSWLGRLVRTRRARVVYRVAAEEAAFGAVVPRVAVARELLADAGAQRAALTGGTPRNAIVECWHRFELTAAAAGVERQAWETSSEHALRILNLVEAAPAPVSRLAGLYREARFSEHELTEVDRGAALESLDEIHRTIGVRV